MASGCFQRTREVATLEKSTLKKQHNKALKISKLEPFTVYTLRHTCLTRWSTHRMSISWRT